MTTSRPRNLADVLASMGAAGRRLNEIDAIESGAGNLSVCLAWQVDLDPLLPDVTTIELPWTAPGLAGCTVLVTGTGCRLREVAEAPRENVGAVVIGADGASGELHYLAGGNFVRPTSEFNSHLAVHADHVGRRGLSLHAVIHAQPPHLVQLSHIPEYRSTESMNHALLRWEPETLVQLPAGVEFLPFMVPGSQELMENTVRGLREHVIVIWAKHGLMARSDASPLGACDKIEYAETGAAYEYRDLAGGGRGEGVSRDELRRVRDAFGVVTDLLD
ncbi:class II aldolase/adducin family protein [Propionibacterium acidifaciens]